MTKMKSKKMTKSTFAVIIMAVLMVAMLAFGGTYAYFTAQSGDIAGSVITGTLSIKSTLNLASSETDLVPNQTSYLGDLSNVTVTGTTWAAYRITLTPGSMTKVDPTDPSKTVDFTETGLPTGVDSYFSLDITDEDGDSLIGTDWIESDGCYYYKYVDQGDAIQNLAAIAPKLAITLHKDAGDAYQGVTFNFTISIEAAQAEYVEGTSKTYTAKTEFAVADAAVLNW